jgi:phage tail protein X
MTFREK